MIKSRIFFALLLVLFSSHTTALGNELTISELENGLTVIHEHDDSIPLVAIDIWLRAGSGHETISTNGVSHFIEHLVFARTNKYAPGEMDIEIETLGATLDARTSKDWVHYSTTVRKEHYNKAISILSEILTNARFDEEDIKNERYVIMDELAKKFSDPMRVSRDILATKLYGDHPYSFPIEGSPSAISKITRDDILDYYKSRYIPSNTALVVVGDIDNTSVIESTSGLFSDRASAEQLSQIPVVKAPANIEKTTIKKAFPLFDYVATGYLAPAADNQKDVCAVDLLLTHLGLGYYSWLKSELIANGLAQDASTGFLTQRESGLISIVAKTAPGDTLPALDAITSKISSIKTDGISVEDLQLAKRSLLGDYAFQRETLIGRATSYGFIWATSGTQEIGKYMQCVNSISVQDIKEAAKTYLAEDMRAQVTLEHK